MIERVISGGQTGADQAGLAVAKRLGIPTGGYVPKGFLTEAGPRPDLAAEYGLKETDTADYAERTERNVRLADGTVVFGDARSPGSMLTIRLCRRHGRPCLTIPARCRARSGGATAPGVAGRAPDRHAQRRGQPRQPGAGDRPAGPCCARAGPAATRPVARRRAEAVLPGISSGPVRKTLPWPWAGCLTSLPVQLVAPARSFPTRAESPLRTAY